MTERHLTRRLEEGPRLCGRDVALLLAALVAVDGQIEHVLVVVGHQIVEPVEFRPRVRKPPATAHHPMEELAMLGVEKQQQLDDGVPGIGAPRLDLVAADLALDPAAGPPVRIDQFAVERRVWSRGRDIADAQMLGHRGDHQVDVHAHELLRGDRGARLHQHFEPLPEAIRIELFVEARSGRPPQVEIEYGLQLIGRRQRDEIAAVLQSAGLDDPVQHLGLQAGNDLLEVRCVHNALEQIRALRECRAASAIPNERAFSQGRRMLPASDRNKQS